MELDDMKQSWAAHGRQLQRGVAVDEPRLKAMLRRKVRRGMSFYVLGIAIEVAFGIALLYLALSTLAAHASEPRYLLAVGALAVFTAGVTGLSTYLLLKVLALDHDAPVTVRQLAVERMKRLAFRAFKWALLGGVVVWLPCGLVLFEAVTGVDALARVDLAWLIANLAFGLVVLAAGQVLSRRYLERTDLAPWARTFVDALSGHALTRSAARLEELAQFTRE